MSDNEPFPREAEVPVKSRTSSINWYANPWKRKQLEYRKRNNHRQVGYPSICPHQLKHNLEQIKEPPSPQQEKKFTYQIFAVLKSQHCNFCCLPCKKGNCLAAIWNQRCRLVVCLLHIILHAAIATPFKSNKPKKTEEHWGVIANQGIINTINSMSLPRQVWSYTDK